MNNKYFFRNRPRFWKSEKVRWTGTIIAVILLITVFTVQNQDIWQNGNISEPDENNSGEIVAENSPSVLDLVPEPPIVSEAENNVENSGNASITAMSEDEAEEDAATVSTPPANWLPPSSTGVFGRGFGYNYDSTYEDYRFHSGVDMTLDMGELVFAIADGKVRKVTNDSVWDGRVEIEHDGGLVSIYLGIIPSGIKEGDEIQAGETVGTVGPAPKAEAADGSHLHLEMMLDSEYVDPLEYLR